MYIYNTCDRRHTDCHRLPISPIIISFSLKTTFAVHNITCFINYYQFNQQPISITHYLTTQQQMPSSNQDQAVMHKLKCIIILSLIFMSIEIAGGLLAHSVAILADAFHLLSDVLAYVISLSAVYYSFQKAPKNLTFGYQRLQPLGALINVMTIWFVTAELLLEATNRIINKSVVSEPVYMLITSLFGLGCNLYIMSILHSDKHVECSHGGHSHAHSHAHSHESYSDDNHGNTCSHSDESRQHEHKSHKHQKHHSVCNSHQLDDSQHKNSDQQLSQQPNSVSASLHNMQEISDAVNQSQSMSFQGKLIKIPDEEQDEKYAHRFSNINLEAAYTHIISDIILSIGVIISALIIYWKGDPQQWTPWQIVDPLCTYFFSVMAIYSTLGVTKDSVRILLNGSEEILITKLQRKLQKIVQISKIESLRVWASNRQKTYGAVRLILRSECRDQCEEVRDKVCSYFQKLQIQPYVQVRVEFESQ